MENFFSEFKREKNEINTNIIYEDPDLSDVTPMESPMFILDSDTQIASLWNLRIWEIAGIFILSILLLFVFLAFLSRLISGHNYEKGFDMSSMDIKKDHRHVKSIQNKSLSQFMKENNAYVSSEERLNKNSILILDITKIDSFA